MLEQYSESVNVTHIGNSMRNTLFAAAQNIDQHRLSVGLSVVNAKYWKNTVIGCRAWCGGMVPMQLQALGHAVR